ncbi:MAG: HEAT repeat domain-containing protein [Planctomycetota bacterium]
MPVTRVVRRAVVVGWASALGVFASGGLVAGMASPAQAQQASSAPSSEQQLKDFIHFVMIANYDVAGNVGTELLSSGLSEAEFVDLVDDLRERGRFDTALARAARVEQLEDVASAMESFYRRGKLARSRAPEEVAKNIELLTGQLLQKFTGRERLEAAGEYALPQLLDALLDGANPALRAEVTDLLIGMGRPVITPLGTALIDLAPEQQELVVTVLGRTGQPTALPYVAELLAATESARVRTACQRAMVELGGDPSTDPAALFLGLAERYYDERIELTNFPGEEHQLLWSYNPGLGLVLTTIRTPVYHEAMAMRSVERVLRERPQSEEALALWIAANYSREIDSPSGYNNPAYPSTRRDAAYFAIAAGGRITQRVLQRSLDDRDTPLARLAIAAIERTAGAANLTMAGDEGREPLLEALSYPDRRVRYDAALALAAAQPTMTFAGSDQVVPILSSAVRNAGDLFAIVLTGRDREEYDRVSGILTGMGYTVLPPSESGLGGLAAPLSEVPGIDLVVTSLVFEDSRLEIERARSLRKLGAAPVLSLVSPDDLGPMERRFGRDTLVASRRGSISRTELVEAVTQLVDRASGGVFTEQEGAEYALRSLAALRDLAVGRNEVLDVSAAATPLIASLPEVSGATQVAVAEVLSFIAQDRAQAAIIDEALDATGGQQLQLLDKASGSAKRFGNLVSLRYARQLGELARSRDLAVATAAVAVIGALELPNTELLPLVLNDEQRDAAAR